MADIVIFYKSSNKDKKYMAIFYKDDTKIKTIHFGASGYDDFTIHKDEDRKKRYISRHKNENWNNYMTAGSLSRYVLWEKPNLKDSMKYYANKFNLKIKIDI